MVVAKTQEAAREAAEWLQDHAITYHEINPQGGIVTLEEAVKQNSYFYDKTMPGHGDALSRLVKVGIIMTTLIGNLGSSFVASCKHA